MSEDVQDRTFKRLHGIQCIECIHIYEIIHPIAKK